MSGPGGDDAVVLRATERWLLRRGLPHLIEGYRAREDVFTRSVGILSFIALVEVVNAVRVEWRWWQNALALLGGAALLVGLFVAVNLVRDRRPFQRPDDVGPVELGLFVVLPALVPLAFGQPGSAALTAAANLVLLLVVYVVTSYGLLPMSRWALSRTVAAVSTVAALVGRALPLLLALTILVFVNTEAWQVAAALPGPLYALTGAMFVTVGLLFLLTRLPGEVRRLDEELGDGGLAGACVGTPVEGMADRVPARPPVEAGRGDGAAGPGAGADLTLRQRANVYLVLLFAQGVQVVLVSLGVFAFFTAFGVIAIRPEVIDSWLGDIRHETLAQATLFGHEVVVSAALLRVAGFVALVAGFSFTVSMVTDAAYREDFFDEVVGQVRQALAVRTVYLAIREGSGGSGQPAGRTGGGSGPSSASVSARSAPSSR